MATLNVPITFTKQSSVNGDQSGKTSAQGGGGHPQLVAYTVP